MEFNAGQIVGKTLVALQPVDLTRLPSDGAPSIYTTRSNQTVGVVQSYLVPGSNRSNLWWAFRDANGRPYYVEHRPGLFDVRAIQQQGVLTLEERKRQADEAAKPVSTKIMDMVQRTVILGVGAYLLATLIKSRPNYATK